MDIKKLQRAIIDGLEDVKGHDIKVFDTTHLTSLFDRVIIASGTSNRQTRSLASSVASKVRETGGKVLSTEGGETGEWVLVDCGDAVVHILQPALRQYYNLEELWGGKAVKVRLGVAKGAAGTFDDDEEDDAEPVINKARFAKPRLAPMKTAPAAEEKKPAAKKVAARKTAAKKTVAATVAAADTDAPVAAKKVAAKRAPRKVAAKKAPVADAGN